MIDICKLLDYLPIASCHLLDSLAIFIGLDASEI